MTVINFKNFKIIYLFLLISSCNAQTDIHSCIKNYNHAKNNYAGYFKNKDSILLKKALMEIEVSLRCPQTKRGAIELKIILLGMLKEYKNGYEFVDSLSENDFSRKYKKSMDYNYFRALDYKEKGDTINHNRVLSETIMNIQTYIKEESMPPGKLDEEAYFDLFFLKKQFEKSEKIKSEINLLEKEYPQEREFFDGLEGSLYENAIQSDPSNNP